MYMYVCMYGSWNYSDKIERKGLIDSDTLFGRFCLSAPQPFGRHTALFTVP